MVLGFDESVITVVDESFVVVVEDDPNVVLDELDEEEEEVSDPTDGFAKETEFAENSGLVKRSEVSSLIDEEIVEALKEDKPGWNEVVDFSSGLAFEIDEPSMFGVDGNGENDGVVGFSSPCWLLSSIALSIIVKIRAKL